MQTISRRKKVRKSSSFTSTPWSQHGRGDDDDYGNSRSSTRASSPDHHYRENALTPQEKKLFLRDDEQSVSSFHPLARVNSPSIHSANPLSRNKNAKLESKKAMVSEWMADMELSPCTHSSPDFDSPSDLLTHTTAMLIYPLSSLHHIMYLPLCDIATCLPLYSPYLSMYLQHFVVLLISGG